jgi:hypothetical protein
MSSSVVKFVKVVSDHVAGSVRELKAAESRGQWLDTQQNATLPAKVVKRRLSEKENLAKSADNDHEPVDVAKAERVDDEAQQPHLTTESIDGSGAAATQDEAGQAVLPGKLGSAAVQPPPKWLIGVVGLVGMGAAGGGGSAGAGPTDDDGADGDDATVTGASVHVKVALGPLVDTTDVVVTLYKADGSVLSGEGGFHESGFYVFTPDQSYSGKVFVRVEDTGSTPDFMDEATGARMNIGTEIWAATEVSVSTSPFLITVSPLSTVAVMKALDASHVADVQNLLSSQAAQADVATANKAVAELFGLGTSIDLVQQPVQFAIDSSGQRTNQSNAYGLALTVVSNFRDTPGKAIADLVAAMSIDSRGVAVLSQGQVSSDLKKAAEQPLVMDQALDPLLALVNVIDVNDHTPVFTSGNVGSVAENAAISTVIYTASATDADGTDVNRTVVYSLKDGGDKALLNINSSTGVVTLKASADFEAKASYTFTVVATDTGSPARSAEKAVTVSVDNSGPIQDINILSDTHLSLIESANFSVAYSRIDDFSGVEQTIAYVKRQQDNERVSTLSIDATAKRIYGDVSNLSDGAYVFVVDSTDTLGNMSRHEQSFVIDKTPPVLHIGFTDNLTPGGTSFDNIVQGTQLNVTLQTGGESVGIQWSVNGGLTWNALSSGQSSFSLNPGIYKKGLFQVKANDAAGNETVRGFDNNLFLLPASFSLGSVGGVATQLANHYTVTDFGGVSRVYYLMNNAITIQQFKDIIIGESDAVMPDRALVEPFKIGNGIFRLIETGDPVHVIPDIAGTYSRTQTLPVSGQTLAPFVSGGILGVYTKTPFRAGPERWNDIWSSNSFLTFNEGFSSGGLAQFKPLGESYTYSPGISLEPSVKYNIALELIDYFVADSSEGVQLTINPVSYDNVINSLEALGAVFSGYVQGVQAGENALKVTLTQGDVSMSWNADVMANGTWSTSINQKINLIDLDLDPGNFTLNVSLPDQPQVLASSIIGLDTLKSNYWIDGFSLGGLTSITGSDGVTRYYVMWDANEDRVARDLVTMDQVEAAFGVGVISANNNSTIIGDGRYKLTLPSIFGNEYQASLPTAVGAFDGPDNNEKIYTPGTWADFFDSRWTGSSHPVPVNWASNNSYWAADIKSDAIGDSQLHHTVNISANSFPGLSADTNARYAVFEFAVL